MVKEKREEAFKRKKHFEAFNDIRFYFGPSQCMRFASIFKQKQ